MGIFAPEIPEVEQALVPLAEKAGPWFFRIGMAGLFASFLIAAGKHIPHWIPYVGHALETAGRAIEHEVQAQKAAEALSAQPALVRFTAGLAHVFEEQAIAQYDLAQHTFAAFEILTGHTIPTASRGAAAGARSAAQQAKAQTRAQAQAQARTASKFAHRTMTVAATADAALALAHHALSRAQAIALPHALPWVDRRVGAVEGKIDRLWKRFRGIPFDLTVGAVGAIALGFLVRNGMGWLRCRNVGKVGKSLCGLPTRWLDDLLSLVTDFAIVSNICIVIPWLERAFSEVAAPLVALLTKAGAGICRGGAGAPELLPAPELHLPASAGTTLYLP